MVTVCVTAALAVGIFGDPVERSPVASGFGNESREGDSERERQFPGTKFANKVTNVATLRACTESH